MFASLLKKHGGKLTALVVGIVIVVMVVAFLMWWLGDPGVKRQDIVRQDGPVEIILITPEGKECRAYVRADVPLVIESATDMDFVVGSVRINTDTLWLHVIGDVEYCLPFTASQINLDEQGMYHVTVDASKIEVNRPRIDMLDTSTSVRYKEGAGRQIAGFIPLLNAFMDTNAHELTVEGLKFAQSLVGSTQCMEAGWEQIRQAIIQSYLDQANEKGVPVEKIDIQFIGEPDFAKYAGPIDTSLLGDGVSVVIGQEGVSCQSLSDALQGVTETSIETP